MRLRNTQKNQHRDNKSVFDEHVQFISEGGRSRAILRFEPSGAHYR